MNITKLAQSDPPFGVSTILLAAGKATRGHVDLKNLTVAVSSTDATGGKSPYTYRWQVSSNRGVSWLSATGTGTTTRSATISSLTRGLTYQFRIRFTDSASSVVYSNVLTVAMAFGHKFFPQLNLAYRRSFRQL